MDKKKCTPYSLLVKTAGESYVNAVGQAETLYVTPKINKNKLNGKLLYKTCICIPKAQNKQWEPMGVRWIRLHGSYKNAPGRWWTLVGVKTPRKRIAEMKCVHGTKKKAKTKRAGTQTSEPTRTVNIEIENSNPITKT